MKTVKYVFVSELVVANKSPLRSVKLVMFMLEDETPEKISQPLICRKVARVEVKVAANFPSLGETPSSTISASE